VYFGNEKEGAIMKQTPACCM